MGVSFTSAARSSNAFHQSVLFRIHEGVSIISDFLLKVGGDSASCSIGEIIPFQELCDVCLSLLNNNVATPSTLIHSSRTAVLGGYTRHCGRSFPSGFPTQIP